jgi:hypothetical protein
MQYRLRAVLSTAQMLLARIALSVSIILTLTFAQTTFAHNSREQTGGVKSSEYVTGSFLSSGHVTSDDKDKDKSSKKAKKKDDDDDDDDDDSSKAKKKKKDGKSLKEDDDDDDDDDKDSSAKDNERSEKVKREDSSDRDKVAAKETAPEVEKEEPMNSNNAVLSADAKYISLSEAIKRARGGGGKGDVLQIDLEWDPAYSLVTWDITFSSGNEYEFDAATGKPLGTKSKGMAKLAALSPLPVGGSGKRLLTFQEIIRKAEASHKLPVIEMELKQIKGRPEIVYEVVLSNNATILYNATTGAKITDL